MGFVPPSRNLFLHTWKIILFPECFVFLWVVWNISGLAVLQPAGLLGVTMLSCTLTSSILDTHPVSLVLHIFCQCDYSVKQAAVPSTPPHQCHKLFSVVHASWLTHSSSYFSTYLNWIHSPSRQRQHIHLQCWDKLITQQGVKNSEDHHWVTLFIHFNGKFNQFH